MTRQERLDDDSVIEDLVVEVGGKEYHGRLKIRRVDRTKSTFYSFPSATWERVRIDVDEGEQ